MFSEKALRDQGINPKTWMQFCRESRNLMIFDTGGGEVDAAESLQMISHLFGTQEAYNLTDAPICATGQNCFGKSDAVRLDSGHETMSCAKKRQVEGALSRKISNLCKTC